MTMGTEQVTSFIRQNEKGKGKKYFLGKQRVRVKERLIARGREK
jgi:hypothetical protein